MSLGYIDDNGRYVKGVPKHLVADVSSQYKEWNHDDQRRRYSGDIIQPYTADGKPNPEFVNVYRGEVASNYFNQEQIDAADRNLGGVR